MKAIVHQYKKGVEGLENKFLSETHPNARGSKSKVKSSRIKS